MKKFPLGYFSAGLAVSLIGSSLAFAQQQQHHQNGPSHAFAPSVRHAAPQMSQNRAPAQHSVPQQAEVSHNHGAPSRPAYAGTSGHSYAGSHQAYTSGHQWHHGDHYNGSRYVINNFGYYNLQQPPYGYEWVQDGDQFVLIAIASGIITDIIVNSTNQ